MTKQNFSNINSDDVSVLLSELENELKSHLNIIRTKYHLLEKLDDKIFRKCKRSLEKQMRKTFATGDHICHTRINNE